MRNFVKYGQTIGWIASGAVTSGQGVQMGALFGVAITAAANGQAFEAALTGVFELPKATGAVAAGQLIYWDTSEAEASTSADSGANKLIGAAIEAAASDAAAVKVRLNGVAA